MFFFAFLCCEFLYGCSSAIVNYSNSLRTVSIPDKLIVGYANWNECDEKIIQAVKEGVNVVMWFAINLAVSADTGLPTITGGPDMDCVATVIAELRDLGYGNNTVHLISIGGWDAPHPETSNPVTMVYEQWQYWNKEIAARPEKGFYGFDGFDWDIEGNDDPDSPNNLFSKDCLDYMGQFSQMAKYIDGYIVSMAPAESYFDPTRNGFDRSLLHGYPEWEPELDPPFRYHGLNAYAYLIAKYDTIPNATEWEMMVNSSRHRQQHLIETTDAGFPLLHSNFSLSTTDAAHTFDFITVQLYESYSHAEYNTSILHMPPAEVLVRFCKLMVKGWEVDFTNDVELGYPYKQFIAVEPSRLVVGLANGWAGGGKFILIYPEEVRVVDMCVFIIIV